MFMVLECYLRCFRLKTRKQHYKQESAFNVCHLKSSCKIAFSKIPIVLHPQNQNYLREGCFGRHSSVPISYLHAFTFVAEPGMQVVTVIKLPLLV